MSDNESIEGVRPKSATVIGILNIIFGGSGILGGLGGLITMVIFRSFISHLGRGVIPELEMIAPTLQSMFSLMIIMYLVTTLIKIAGLVSGIGLLGRQRWSRLLSNIYAIATIVVSFATFFFIRRIFGLILDNPYVMGEMPYDERYFLEAFSGIMSGISAAISVVFNSAYPVVILALINRKKIREYYDSGESTDPGEKA